MKLKTNIKVDIALIPALVILIVTGIGIHVSDEVEQHALWHGWAVAHVISGALFLGLGIAHVRGHWGWFRSLLKTFRKKSRATIALTLLFLAETVTGIILLAFTDGGHSHIGLWHWWLGLLMAAFGIGHLLKRLKILKSGYRRTIGQ